MKSESKENESQNENERREEKKRVIEDVAESLFLSYVMTQNDD